MANNSPIALSNDPNFNNTSNFRALYFRGFPFFGKIFVPQYGCEVKPYLHFIEYFFKSFEGQRNLFPGAQLCYFSSFYASNTMATELQKQPEWRSA